MKKPLLAVFGGNPRLPVEDNTEYQITPDIIKAGVFRFNAGLFQQDLDTTFLDAAVAKNVGKEATNNNSSFWQWLGHAGKELLLATADALEQASNAADSGPTASDYYKPMPFKEYQAPSRTRNTQVMSHRTGPFSA